MAAVAKPPGRIVVPGRGTPERTVREEAEAQLGPLWVVHRLDRGTSGVLLFARSADAHRTLCGAFEHHRVAKRYLALVRGVLSGDRRIDAAVEGRASTTFLRLFAAFPPGASLIEAFPASGRTHQIRVHLARAGHPLLVDPDYGEAPPWRSPGGCAILERTPLHAASLEMLHPVSGEPVRIDAPIPPDMRGAIEALRADQESKRG
ncbi:MAG: RluA family pseudouridine synthase [Deltaproteobacteria bacterium]|nr:RluA family pseudouridine synthase [Deltaproteobacteria bacterium]